MLADVVDIVEANNENLLWLCYIEASRRHHSMVVRIIELKLVGSMGPTLLQDKTSEEVCRAHST